MGRIVSKSAEGGGKGKPKGVVGKKRGNQGHKVGVYPNWFRQVPQSKDKNIGKKNQKRRNKRPAEGPGVPTIMKISQVYGKN